MKLPHKKVMSQFLNVELALNGRGRFCGKMNKVEAGEVFGDWQYHREIGSGGFGLVTAWKNQITSEMLVIKQCKQKLDPRNKGRWQDEIQLMNSNKHINLVAGRPIPTEIENALRSPEPLLGLEYCESDLRKLLGNAIHSCGLKEKMVVNILKDVSCGLEFLHKKNIVHRDLKPENILLCHQGNNVIYKITDLGYAKQLDARSICMSFVGTIQYLAPELYDYQSGYNRTADYWSFGTVIFECITGTRPFLLTEHAFQWPKLIKDKSDQHIWGYNDDLSNSVKFCADIPSPNHMCPPLLDAFKNWLQMVLKHDPKTRGKNEKGEIICYTTISSILDMKIIHILNVLTCIDVAYECRPDDCGSHLKAFLKEHTGIPIKNQLILFPCGDELEDDDSLERCHQQPDLIYLFNKNKRAEHNINIFLSQRVRELAGSPDELRKYPDLKLYWSHSLYDCSKMASEYEQLLRGQRALMINMVRTKYKKCEQLKEEFVKAAIRLDSIINIYEESYNCDLQFYKKTDLTEEEASFLEEWRVMYDEVKSFAECINNDILKEITQVQEQCSQLQQSPLISEQKQNELEELSCQAEKKVDKLRRAPPEYKDKKHDSKHIYEIIMKCVSEKERLLRIFYEHLKKVVVNRYKLTDLINKISEQNQVLKDKADIILKRQLYRQGLLWRLFGSQLSSPGSSMTSNNSFIPSMMSKLDTADESESSSQIIDDMEDTFKKLENLLNNEDEQGSDIPSPPNDKYGPVRSATVDGSSTQKACINKEPLRNRRESAPASYSLPEDSFHRPGSHVRPSHDISIPRIPRVFSEERGPISVSPSGMNRSSVRVSNIQTHTRHPNYSSVQQPASYPYQGPQSLEYRRNPVPEYGPTITEHLHTSNSHLTRQGHVYFCDLNKHQHTSLSSSPSSASELCVLNPVTINDSTHFGTMSGYRDTPIPGPSPNASYLNNTDFYNQGYFKNGHIRSTNVGGRTTPGART
ncbi:inhibitor of nuclear factor kappa-B kinase subunit alpha-like isoform X1 [Hydractinia symbiolongicarpus]|uniref:inhibitor of nuclear factor kappa-B kinase subunit alpha-like isoform X1 n=2 Tax=Hydractinia symbiolongicarpus TaxID=13093 RepID=UPI002550A862|nr:inhibitor of nuclear factor kappa-B kinase subunit alpha-like isoform X1 [Hydractinia symbiolongicarpus]